MVAMEGESKVMVKWQTVIPKKVREAANIGVGDTLRWKYEAGKITITAPRRVRDPSNMLYGLIPSCDDAVEEVRRSREERLEKIRP